MDELLTEQILADACEYQANFIGGGTNHNTINTSPKLPSTNRSSLLKQLSSKLLQTTTKSTNNENVNSTINSNLSNSTATVSNLIPTNSVNLPNTSSNQTTAVNTTDLTKSTLSTDNLTNSTSSLNSTNSSTSVCLSNGTKINSDQVNCKLNNCPINETTINQINLINNQVNQTNNQTNNQISNQISNQINSTVTNQSQSTNQTITMTNCNKCLVKFTVFRRKHQCTKCNKPFCSNCLQKIKIKLCLDCSLDDQQQSKQIVEQTKTIDNNSTTINNLQIISKEVIDNQSIVNVQKSDDCTDTIQNNIKYLNNQLNNDNNLIKLNSDQQTVSQQNIELNNQLKNQINQLNNQINDNDKLNNLSINSNNIQTNLTADINQVNVNLTNTNITTSSTTNKNEFVIISVLKKQGVTKPKLQNDNTTKKYVKFEDGYRPGDENIIEQQRSQTIHLPSLMMNANLMANLAAAQTNLTATSQIGQSRISFKPFLAHSQLTTYAQKGLLLNNVTSSHSSSGKSRKRHLSSSHRHQLTQQKLIQLSAANGNSLRNTAATYTVLTKSAGSTKLNQTSPTNKHLINNTARNTNNNRKFVYLNGKLLVNSYSNYNDYYIKSNDLFQNEKMFTSYVLLA